MQQTAGFTLLELMVVLAVVGVLAAVGIPNFQSFVRDNRLAAQTNDLVSALALARSEAMKRNVNVTVCRSNNPTAAAPACAVGVVPGEGWEDGWVVFVESDSDCNPANGITGLGTLAANDADRDCDGAVDLGEDRDGIAGFLVADAILQTRGPLSGGTTLRGNNNVVNRVTFNTQGMMPGFNGTLKLCDSRGYTSSREIITAFTGRVHVCKLTTQGCDTPAGTFLTTCTP